MDNFNPQLTLHLDFSPVYPLFPGTFSSLSSVSFFFLKKKMSNKHKHEKIQVSGPWAGLSLWLLHSREPAEGRNRQKSWEAG